MIDKQETDRRVKLWEQGYWEVPDGLDTTGFNFDWRPHQYDRPYIHQFGTQWQKTGGPRFVVPENEGVKYQHHMIAKKLPEPERFRVLVKDYDVVFDWSWHPDDTEPAFIWTFGNQFKDAYEMPTIEYWVEGATERKQVNSIIAKLIGKKEFWRVLIPIEDYGFDFNWCPDLYEPPFVYTWGNQWNDGTVEPTVEYWPASATEQQYFRPVERKYMTNFTPRVKQDKTNWKILIPIDESTFDFSWRPSPHEPPYIYVWGNSLYDATIEPTIEYHVPGATQYKYMSNQRPVVQTDWSRWKILKSIDEKSFDWSWHPHPHEPAYIYVWGNQWHDGVTDPTVEYWVEGATERKYITEQIAKLKSDYESNKENWKILIPVDTNSFDWSWRPSPYEPPYIYTWGNQWNEATIEPTIEYWAEGATERKYITDTVVKVLPITDTNLWTIPKNFDQSKFDWSWRPNPGSPPQVYQWENGGPIYTVPGATEVVLMSEMKYDEESSSEIPKYWIETTLDELIKQHPDEVFWALNSDLKYDNFDFNWKPNDGNFRHINAFGNKNSKDTGTYYINAPVYLSGYREINYVEDHEIDIDTDLDMFYVVVGDNGSDERYENLKQIYPKLQKTRFLNNWVNTISRCLRKSTSRFVWILSSDCDYTDFKFDYYPSSWVQDKIHVFGNQWTHWGNTYLVNRETFDESTRYIKILEHLPNINHVRSKRAPRLGGVTDIVYIDHGNNTNSLTALKNRYPSATLTVLPYRSSYLHTLRDWIKTLPEYYIRDDHPLWICSSICHYDSFDFSWVPDPFQSDQLHVFSSELDGVKQKFGDTFFVNLKTLSEEIKGLADLERYGKKINYVSYLSAKRWEHLAMYHDHDSQVDAVSEFKNNFSGPYIELINDKHCPEVKRLVPNVWNLNKTDITVGTTGATQILVPRPAFDRIGLEVYDYPHISKLDKPVDSKPIDIVFISNGEPAAEENYRTLEQTLAKQAVKNRLHWVRDVSGRVASQHAAASISDTDWYFLVNGKIKINPEFDWQWQPDRLQEAKHYIFTATNPVNGLEYGHQAIVANNRRLTLATVPTGLDFTLESPHAVVEQNCGVAVYNTDPWTTWRTAFREAIKLRNNTDDVSRERLDIWCTVGNGDFGEWSTRGALDAVEYYDSVQGELDKLMLSYDWAWLREYYNVKYQ